MVSAKRLTKRSPRRSHLLLVGCLLMLSLLGVFLDSESAHAAGLSGDPPVVIAVDATEQSPVPCKLTFRVNIGTSQEAKETVPCPAKTIMHTMIVPRSQALKQHEPYVLVSSLGASRTSKAQIDQQLANVSSNQMSSARVHFLTTACGQEGNATLIWGRNDNATGNYFIATSTVTFYILPSPHCNQVVFETSTLGVDAEYCSVSSPCYGWTDDRYADAYYNLPTSNGYWYLTTDDAYSHSIDLENSKGYTYEQILGGVTDFFWTDFFWCDIPIN